MSGFAIAFVFSLLSYLLLTAGSGKVLLWSREELLAGAILSLLSAALAARLFKAIGMQPSLEWLNPKRWLLLIAYGIGPFFFSLAKANLDVAYRVITGRIKPGIVRVSPELESKLALTLLANSITLTPGTLSVDLDEKGNLYVHWINVKSRQPKPEQVYGSFAKWARRIAE